MAQRLSEERHCETCTCAPPDVDCAAILPGTEADVIPIRCRLAARDHPHPYSTHWHPSLWQGTPDLIWPLT